MEIKAKEEKVDDKIRVNRKSRSNEITKEEKRHINKEIKKKTNKI